MDRIINDPAFDISDDDIGTRYTRCEDNVIDGHVSLWISARVSLQLGRDPLRYEVKLRKYTNTFNQDFIK